MQEIIQCDCLEGLKQIGQVDVVVTSPPYNIGIKYNAYNDRLAQANYLNWMDDIAAQIKKVLKSDGSFFLNVGSTCVNPDISTQIKERISKHFILQNHIVWVKSISVPVEDRMRSFGHFKPIKSDRFLNHQFEDIYHFTKSGAVKLDRLAVGVPYEDKSNISRWEGRQDIRCGGNVWFIPYKTVRSKKKHPSGFPVGLPEKCILLHGLRKEMVVLDPFLGAGTTLLACKNLGVKGIGLEIDELYVRLAKEMLAH